MPRARFFVFPQYQRSSVGAKCEEMSHFCPTPTLVVRARSSVATDPGMQPSTRAVQAPVCWARIWLFVSKVRCSCSHIDCASPYGSEPLVISRSQRPGHLQDRAAFPLRCHMDSTTTAAVCCTTAQTAQSPAQLDSLRAQSGRLSIAATPAP
jgi:hypothetical protein